MNLYHFTHDKVIPADPKAKEFAVALTSFIRIDQELHEARARVPKYTGQWSSKDYYAEEEEGWNRAAEILYSKIKY